MWTGAGTLRRPARRQSTKPGLTADQRPSRASEDQNKECILVIHTFESFSQHRPLLVAASEPRLVREPEESEPDEEDDFDGDDDDDEDDFDDDDDQEDDDLDDDDDLDEDDDEDDDDDLDDDEEEEDDSDE